MRGVAGVNPTTDVEASVSAPSRAVDPREELTGVRKLVVAGNKLADIGDDVVGPGEEPADEVCRLVTVGEEAAEVRKLESGTPVTSVTIIRVPTASEVTADDSRGLSETPPAVVKGSGSVFPAITSTGAAEDEDISPETEQTNSACRLNTKNKATTPCRAGKR